MPQLSFDLRPQSPHSLDYFVPHSGVSEAYAVLQQCVNEIAADEDLFRFVLLTGPSGAGKTHLVEGFFEKARAAGAESLVHVTDLENVGEFIARYESLRANGGLMIVETCGLPENPHLQSRMLSGYMVKVCYPQESELRPLLVSLAERRNLRLSDYSINYLVRALPLDLLSFDRIFSALNDVSLSQNRMSEYGRRRAC